MASPRQSESIVWVPGICYGPSNGMGAELKSLLGLVLIAALVVVAILAVVLGRRLWIRMSPPAPLSPGRARGLAASALIIEVNGGRHDLLGGGFPADDARALLASAWNSHDRATVRRTLVWLENEGHRHRWEAMLQAFEDGDPELEEEAFADPELRAELDVVNRFGQRHRSLVAWDLCRAVALVRFAFAGEYLAEAESWQWVERFGAMIRSSFTSWREMSDNYMVGREFSSGPPDTDLMHAQLSLLDPTNPSSPWNQIGWR
jgi:Protein of unknown function (DUF1266)